jgi:hypothetical protein
MFVTSGVAIDRINLMALIQGHVTNSIGKGVFKKNNPSPTQRREEGWAVMNIISDSEIKNVSRLIH